MGPDFLANCEAILVRQRLQVWEQLCAICERSNKYNFAATSTALANRSPPPTDQEFWTQIQLGFIRVCTCWGVCGAMQCGSFIACGFGGFLMCVCCVFLPAQENSSCCCRVCCHKWRETEFGFYVNEQKAMQCRSNMMIMSPDNNMRSLCVCLAGPGGGLPPVDFMQVSRPFKCSLPCCCCFMLCPQEATFRTPQAAIMGSAVWDWRCFRFFCCGEIYVAIRDQAGTVQ